MTRACFEPASFFFSRSVVAGCGGFAVVARAAVDLGGRFFADIGIGILDSVYGGVAPHYRSPTSANRRGRIPGRSSGPNLTTVPLQSPTNASPFWIMLLLSSGADERRIIDQAARSVTDSEKPT